jgi:pimeloyl-ACP methyl ester carboxylesterase
MRPIPVKGLAYQFWKRGNCRQIVIEFRGTDPLSTSDWYSNFRWVTRFLPFADEYDQVRQNINAIIDEARASTGCPNAPIVTVGHSLGGGLAQLAAYSHDGINRVYVFDPSPVTAYYDVDQLTRQRDTKDLIIDRVYEKGEVLALPRRITESISQPSVCDPQVRTAEFNTIAGFTFAINPITQHSIERLMVGLVDFVKGVHRRELRPELLRQQAQDAADCIIKLAAAKGQKFAQGERRRMIAKLLRAQKAAKKSAQAPKELRAASR